MEDIGESPQKEKVQHSVKKKIWNVVNRVVPRIGHREVAYLLEPEVVPPSDVTFLSEKDKRSGAHWRCNSNAKEGSKGESFKNLK